MNAQRNDGRSPLGKRVRFLRKRAGQTLQDLAAATGLSKPTLSKIENGVISASYGNLLKLAEGLGVGISHLFDRDSDVPSVNGIGWHSVTRKGAAPVYEAAQYRYEILSSDLEARKFFPILATLPRRLAASKIEMTGHAGEEFAFVLEGAVEILSEYHEAIRLGPGDSIYFDSKMKHALISASDSEAKILWIATSNRIAPKGE